MFDGAGDGVDGVGDELEPLLGPTEPEHGCDPVDVRRVRGELRRDRTVDRVDRLQTGRTGRGRNRAVGPAPDATRASVSMRPRSSTTSCINRSETGAQSSGGPPRLAVAQVMRSATSPTLDDRAITAVHSVSAGRSPTVSWASSSKDSSARSRVASRSARDCSTAASSARPV